MRVTVGHFEVSARDPARIGRFFREAFGWRAEPVAWSGPSYWKLRPEASAEALTPLGGGVLEAAEPAPPLLVFHLDEGALEVALERIAAAGGRAEGELRTIDPFGRFARFRDPEGNLYGLWEPARA